MKESIIITYHKNKDMLLFCLNRLLKTTPDDVEILIIGNNVNRAELDEDISKFPIYVNIYRNHRSKFTISQGS
ncbi:MAG: hypothetical protein ACLUGQ_08370 [Coprococcus sp.]